MIIYESMNYYIELRTAAGPLSFGPFSTVDEARTWSAGHGLILALLPASCAARQIITATRNEITRLLETGPEKKS